MRRRRERLLMFHHDRPNHTHLDALTTRSEIMAASLEQKSALQLGLWRNRFEHRLHQSTEQMYRTIHIMYAMALIDTHEQWCSQ